MAEFAHLHCHTEYSLLDGAISIEHLCKKAKDCGMPAVAITDHGNLHGALQFYLTAKKIGIKPIIGCEIYVCNDHTDKSSEHARKRYHLVLLAQNKKGYHNLIKLVSYGALHGFYVRPRVDKELLAKYSEGIVALSACLAGEIPRKLMNEGYDSALECAKEYSKIFPNRFFLELQENGLPEQKQVNNGLVAISKETGLPLVATNDCHYLNKEDFEAHDILLCIQTQAKVTDEKRMRFNTKQLYYKTQEEMEKDFINYPEAFANAGYIATDLCEDYDLDLDDYHFPNYEIPSNSSIEEEFCRLAREGLEKRLDKMQYNVDPNVYKDRLEMELSVICEMKFPGYFLIVQDFINWAKNNNIPVGPGRGSAAGSLVAYSLRITNIDPIQYNLLFERFLNIERISMPDIDVDFCEEKRPQVIEYVVNKYGSDSVAQITTFGKMMAKGVIRDVGRALGMSFQETDQIAKMIPNDLKMTIAKAMEMEPKLKDLYAYDPLIKKLIDNSIKLEGLNRHASIHAAGLVISDKPMTEYLPLYRGKRDEDIVTQFDMKMVEKVGLIKFDFLGLRNMTVIYDTLNNIKIQGKTPPDIDSIPLNDPKTYKMYASGDTDGIFQVESSGMRQYLRMLRPTVFEDIIAMLALYRPGPLKTGMVLEFIKRKHGQIEVKYIHDSLEACLKDTYGVIVYQEQVMQIAQIISGYSLGEADLLRRAMGKKDPTAMAKERGKFVEGAEKNGISAEKANSIFDLMETFAEYGFNKSHSAAYALISYQTAYLKTHHTVEFMAAILSSELHVQDKLLKYVAACKDMNITVHSPSIQNSFWKFTVKDNAIVFGLGGIKNVGLEAVKEIALAREEGGEFTSLLDLCLRVSGRKLTKRALESLIKAGCCDCFNVSRAAMMASLDAVVAKAQQLNKAKNSNQASLLNLVPEEEKPVTRGIGFSCPEENAPEWSPELVSKFEKEALGFFLNNHPLIPYQKEIKRLHLVPLEEIRELPPETNIKTAVLITSIRELFDKKGRRWGLMEVEDLTTSGTCFCFSEAYAEYQHLLKSEQPLYLEGQISKIREEDKIELSEGEEAPPKEVKFTCNKVLLLRDACDASTAPISITLNNTLNNYSEVENKISKLQEILLEHKGSTPVQVLANLGSNWCLMGLGHNFTVRPSPELHMAISEWESVST